MKDLDRRTFLTGAGVLAAAGLTSAMVGCSSGNSSTASEGSAESDASCEIGSGNQPYPWDSTPPVIAEEDIEETLECDVLVAGTGIAGACAIRAAAEEGAKVIYCDKQAQVSSSSGDIAIFGANDNSVQATWGRVNKYDWDMIVDHEMDEGSYFPKRAIWSKWAHNNGDVFQWYIQAFTDLGGELIIAKDEAEGYAFMSDSSLTGWIKPNFYPDPVGYDAVKEMAEGGHPCFLTSMRCDQLSFNHKCVEVANNKGAQGFFNSAIVQLIKDGDRVSGGYIYSYDTGKYKKVNASKGVILATGDYSGNKDCEAYFLPDVFKNGNVGMGMSVDPEGNSIYQGDHLKLGDWVGARIQQHHAPMIHHMGNMAGFGAADAQGMGIAPYLRLNKLGKRFMNENCPGQQTENQIEIQPLQMCYMFWDSNWTELVPNFPPMHGSFITPTKTGPNAFDGLIEKNAVKKGETIEELLDALGPEDGNWIGIDKEVALESIKRYQEICKQGKDVDFNKPSNLLTSFDDENGPFYATYFVKASNLVNLGGLSSDEDCHTFDKETGNILPGLYVAGNTQGDRFCVQYPIALEGAASSICMYYGYVAGQNCAKGI